MVPNVNRTTSEEVASPLEAPSEAPQLISRSVITTIREVRITRKSTSTGGLPRHES